MSNVRMDPVFSNALRTGLVQHVGRAPHRRRRNWLAAGAVILAGLSGGSVAVASGILPLPGADHVTQLGASVTETHTGPATLNLGAVPDGATHLSLELTCLSAGTFTLTDGAGLRCTEIDAGNTSASYDLPLSGAGNAAAIQTTEGAKWQATATYVALEATGWAVNENGQTYGVQNDHGTPDLVAAIATNGQAGYVYSSALQGPEFGSPEEALAWQRDHGEEQVLPVYEADGVTVIGEFIIARARETPKN